MTTVLRTNLAFPALVVLAILGQSALGDRGIAGKWVDCRVVGPFVCRTDFQPRGLERLFEQLAALQADLVEQLGVEPATEPIELYLFRNEWNYRRFLKRHLPRTPYRRALFVKDGGPGRVFVHLGREFEVDVRHECTHALLHSALPMVPLWLDEGLAEYFEVPPEQRAFDNPYLNRVKWNLRLGMYPRLDKLEKEGDFSKLGHSDYRDSWAWVHFMLHGPAEAHDELVRFLADIRSSTPPGLLSQRLSRRLPNLKKRFSNHFKTWRRVARRDRLSEKFADFAHLSSRTTPASVDRQIHFSQGS